MNIGKHISVSSAKDKLFELLGQVEDEHENIVITKNSLPKAVLLNYEEFSGLLETIDILADQQGIRALRAGLKDVQAGLIISLADAFDELSGFPI